LLSRKRAAHPSSNITHKVTFILYRIIYLSENKVSHTACFGDFLNPSLPAPSALPLPNLPPADINIKYFPTSTRRKKTLMFCDTQQKKVEVISYCKGNVYIGQPFAKKENQGPSGVKENRYSHNVL